MSVARVHVRAWQAAYRNLMPEAYLSNLRPEDRAKRYTFAENIPARPQTLVAEESGTILGFATISPVGDELKNMGELNALYVDPACWRRHVGAALELAAAAALRQLGCDPAMLWVLAGNGAAIQFYESRGWKSEFITREADVWGIRVHEVQFARAL